MGKLIINHDEIEPPTKLFTEDVGLTMNNCFNYVLALGFDSGTINIVLTKYL